MTEPSRQPSGTARERILAYFARVNAEPSGLAAAATVFAGGALFSWLFWTPLGLPSDLIKMANPFVGNCTGFAPASALMYLCSVKVAALTLVGPVGLIVLAFVFRKTLSSIVNRYKAKVPRDAQFMVAPMLATAIFALSWAGVHFDTGAQSGILPQTIFPGVVGLFTFAVARWGPAIQRAARPAFDLRDRFPMRARVAAAILIPLAVSLVVTAEQRVSNTAFKEQLVVLIGLATGFVVLAPRQGDLLSGIARQVGGLRSRA